VSNILCLGISLPSHLFQYGFCLLNFLWTFLLHFSFSDLFYGLYIREDLFGLRPSFYSLFALSSISKGFSSRVAHPKREDLLFPILIYSQKSFARLFFYSFFLPEKGIIYIEDRVVLFQGSFLQFFISSSRTKAEPAYPSKK